MMSDAPIVWDMPLAVLVDASLASSHDDFLEHLLRYSTADTFHELVPDEDQQRDVVVK